MTLAGHLDLAYLLLAEKTEALMNANLAGASVFAEDETALEGLDFASARQRLDAMLEEPLANLRGTEQDGKPMTREAYEWRKAVGLL